MTTLTLAAPMVLDHDGDKYDGPHRRRMSDRKGSSLEARLDRFDADLADVRRSLPDVNRLRFTWKEVSVVVVASVGIVFANYQANAPLRTELSNIQKEQAAQKDATSFNTQLTTERMNTMREKVDELTKGSTLQQMKLDELTNKVLDMMRRVR